MVNGSTVFPKFVGFAGEQFPLMRVAPPVGGWGPPPPPGLETRRSPIIVTQLVWTDGCQVDSHDGVTGQDHITIYMQRRILDKKYQILRPYYIQKLIDLTPPTNEGVKSTRGNFACHLVCKYKRYHIIFFNALSRPTIIYNYH